jgi:hypothetical protein
MTDGATVPVANPRHSSEFKGTNRPAVKNPKGEARVKSGGVEIAQNHRS